MSASEGAVPDSDTSAAGGRVPLRRRLPGPGHARSRCGGWPLAARGGFGNGICGCSGGSRSPGATPLQWNG
eukprot:10253812-Lingulodinium_polyedra.AAC.1